MLVFVVARGRLDRYEELRRHFGDWRDVRVILDRREGEQGAPSPTYADANRRRRGRLRVDIGVDSFVKLGWSVVDTEGATPY